MQNGEKKLFIGTKISEKLYDQLDTTTKSMQQYFKHNDPEYLQIREIDNDEYIGKAIESGVSLESVSNIFMNVKTMLKMICPSFALADDAIKIIAIAPISTRTLF
jgi:hypothetical protein